VLNAQSDILQQRDAATTLDAQAVSAQLALIKALGGGYRSDIAEATQSHSPSSDRTESQ
jgi:multidrug efflux system outer membrane protein